MDGVIFDELLSPVSFGNGILVCEKMRLADFDESGRRGITGTGEMVEVKANTVISAVGARVDTEHFKRNGIALNGRGLPLTNAANESSVPDVYIAGDCRAGAATVVKAIADGKTAAADILRKLGLEADFAAPVRYNTDAARLDSLGIKKGAQISTRQGKKEAERCLSCGEVCESCVDVCPNRANVSVLVTANGTGNAAAARQVVHIDRMCNECGNCAVFCPHIGMPYKEKFTVFKTRPDFDESVNPGFLPTGEGRFLLRLEDKSVVDWRTGEGGAPAHYAALIGAILEDYPYVL
jgi:putative selenate reductase